MFKVTTLFLIFLLTSCSDSQEEQTSGNCNRTAIESSLNQELNSFNSSTDFTFYIERADGLFYLYDKGLSSLDTSYRSASTSKWVSAAVILWAVDQLPGFNLNDSVTDHFAWTMPVLETLNTATLDNLLSFTSGLQNDPNCLSLGIPSKNFNNCINDSSGSLVSVNSGNSFTPNDSFHYSAAHLQTAGAMAIAAGSYAGWQALFLDFKTTTNLFPNSSYNLPSLANPRLAGGMTWTGRDYIAFLKALYNKSLLSSTTHNEMFRDQVGSLNISYSPAFTELNEQWRYGYGVWLECKSSSFNCSNVEYYSSPGAYGAYPFINFSKNFFGLIAREGNLGTFPEGVTTFRNVQELAEDWAACQN